MSILTDASLIITPNAVKAGSLLAVVPSNGNGDLTWTRNSGATRVNSAGLIENVLANVPRLDHSLGGCPSILLEPQRTNLLSSSDDFGSLSWAKQFCSVLTNTIQSPDNSINADTLLANTLGVGQASQVFRNISITINTPYTISIYAKKNTSNFVFFREYFSTNSEKITWFNLLTGQVSTVAIGHTATITNIGNDWYRCVVTTTPNATRTSSLGIGVSDSNNSLVITSTSSIFIWGAQLEAGAYPTSYIPTTSATVTRVADTFSRNNIFTNGLISASGGTWFVEIENNLALVRDSALGLFLNQAINNTLYGFHIVNSVSAPTSARLSLRKIDVSGNNVIYQTTTDKIKVAITWNGTTANVFVNGVKVVTATAFTTTNMEFLASDNRDVPKYIKQMWLENAPMSDVQLIAATTL